VQTGAAYSIRRSREGCSEEAVKSGLEDDEDLCARKIDELSIVGAPQSLDLPVAGPRPRMKRRTSARPLAFKF
jgi:hypothetical protein